MVPALSPMYNTAVPTRPALFHKPAVPVQYSTGANDGDDDVRVACPFLYGRPAPIVTIED